LTLGLFFLLTPSVKCTKCKCISLTLKYIRCKARIRLEIEIELEFNQSEEKKPVSGLVNFALIGQNPIQSQS